MSNTNEQSEFLKRTMSAVDGLSAIVKEDINNRGLVVIAVDSSGIMTSVLGDKQLILHGLLRLAKNPETGILVRTAVAVSMPEGVKQSVEPQNVPL